MRAHVVYDAPDNGGDAFYHGHDTQDHAHETEKFGYFFNILIMILRIIPMIY